MFTHLVFGPWFAGLILLAGGLAAIRKELATTKAYRWPRIARGFVTQR
jgi:hypothetical protein